MAVALGVVALLTAAQPASAHGDSGAGSKNQTSKVCKVTTASVYGAVAKFTVGPEGCSTKTDEISFSTYSLPTGNIRPFAEQVLFAHAEGNGATYGAGSYELTAPLPYCNWQADLYFGPSQSYAPHEPVIWGLHASWDFVEGQTCAPVSVPPVTPPVAPAPEPAETETPVPTETPSATPSETPAPAESVAPSVPTTPTEEPAPAIEPSVPAVPTSTPTSDVLSASGTPSPTYTSDVLSAGPTSKGSVLAATGSPAGAIIGGAAVLLLAGLALVLLRRRSLGTNS